MVMFMYLLLPGGPLIVPGAKSDVLIGLVSWGVWCSRYPSVFARVSSGYNWMKSIICEMSSVPPKKICDASYAPTPTPPSLSPTMSLSPTVVPVEGFSFVGHGQCLDNNNDYYSAFATWLNGTDYRVCIEWCAQIPHFDFVGVMIYTYWHEYYDDEFACFCQFSTRIPDEINVTDYDPSADAWWNDHAYGSIQNTTEEDDLWSCYRYDVSLSN
jgi:hypothetical protein